MYGALLLRPKNEGYFGLASCLESAAEHLCERHTRRGVDYMRKSRKKSGHKKKILWR